MRRRSEYLGHWWLITYSLLLGTGGTAGALCHSRTPAAAVIAAPPSPSQRVPGTTTAYSPRLRTWANGCSKRTTRPPAFPTAPSTSGRASLPMRPPSGGHKHLHALRFTVTARSTVRIISHIFDIVVSTSRRLLLPHLAISCHPTAPLLQAALCCWSLASSRAPQVPLHHVLHHPPVLHRTRTRSIPLQSHTSQQPDPRRCALRRRRRPCSQSAVEAQVAGDVQSFRPQQACSCCARRDVVTCDV